MYIVFLLLAIVGLSSGFHVQSVGSRNKFHSAISILFNDKTPLVAGGKRVEADPGSSMLAACKQLGLKVPLVRLA